MSEPKALIQPDRGTDAIAIHLVNKDGFEAFAKGLSAGQRAALGAQRGCREAGREGCGSANCGVTAERMSAESVAE
jgi:hypothetical protein